MSKYFARVHFRNRAFSCLLPLVVLLSSGAVPAGAPPAVRPEVSIKWRQSAFQVIAWNTARIKAALSRGDLQELRIASTTLAALANSGLANLFPPNTAHGKGWRETTARSEVFGDAEQFRAASEEFARESATLAKVAGGPDLAAVDAQFAKVAKTCKACHDKFRQTD
jgi:cytochrome c556